MEHDNLTEIKNAAIKIFSEKGYREAKITDIAEKAGVSVGTIYTYFKGKKELFQSLNLSELENYRPTQEKKKSEILKTALSVFRVNGYSATSMDQIASKCGFTKAVLYQYFKSKEELFSAIFQETSLIGDLDNLAIEYTNENLEEVLVKVGYTFMKMFEDEDRLNLTRIVIAESLRFPQLGESMYNCGINEVAEKFSKYLRILSEKGIIQCVNPKLTARSYFGLLYSFIITGKIMSSMDKEFSVDEIIEYASQLFMSNLKLKN
ncbi:MAG: TetR/AcrR family transcriptional regulator [Bacillota bacterium]|nr:TetR/AcrR family transcriptional regulator [Bacillota bacterium]